MEVQVEYTDREDRKVKIKIQEDQGLRMTSDNFGSGWKHGEEPHGVMTFTDEPELKASTLAGRNLAAELDELKAEVEALKK